MAKKKIWGCPLCGEPFRKHVVLGVPCGERGCMIGSCLACGVNYDFKKNVAYMAPGWVLS